MVARGRRAVLSFCGLCLILFVGRSATISTSAAWVVGVLAAISFACGILATRDSPTLAFYELPTRAWEFAAGGLFVFGATRATPSPRSRKGASKGGMTGAVMILGNRIAGEGRQRISRLDRAGPRHRNASYYLFAGMVAPRRGVSAVLCYAAAPVSRCQILFLVFLALAVPGVCRTCCCRPSRSRRKTEAAIASLLTAALTYRWIEQPIRTLSRYLARRRNLSLSAAAGAGFANHWCIGGVACIRTPADGASMQDTGSFRQPRWITVLRRASASEGGIRKALRAKGL